ncbi:hypothetical protein GWI33_015820 [Rhynchophorus ferrugineus]|uniref:Uncharacterized protein n=1 Tax=Rhynchophorus ferrugineus TaxID=354439 RepID=A0A834I016_RHYFE|nr:hypothetical protein GWI33_015820 [Rhynchophorus ferrugineus]
MPKPEAVAGNILESQPSIDQDSASASHRPLPPRALISTPSPHYTLGRAIFALTLSDNVPEPSASLCRPFSPNECASCQKKPIAAPLSPEGIAPARMRRGEEARPLAPPRTWPPTTVTGPKVRREEE